MIKTVFDKLDKILKISENIKLLNIENFISLTDTVILNTASIIEQIKPSNYEEIKDDIKEINTIIKNITNRKIYKCLYQSSYKTTSKINTEQLINKIIEKNKKINIELKKEKIIPLIKKIGLISGNKPHPFNNLYFYGKNYDSKVLSKNKMSQLISPFFQENILFLINSSLEE
jgi:predicted RND superfamily exporter protein